MVYKVARQSLFCLAQHSEQGFQEANALIHKLLKKRADNTPLDNPSGFVTKCSFNARAAMSQASGTEWWGTAPKSTSSWSGSDRDRGWTSRSWREWDRK